MRPKYKEDVTFMPTSDGVYLRSSKSRLMLKGKSLYPLLKHLVPHLNGSVTLEELTAGLIPAKQRMVTQLIEKLLAHDFVRDSSQERCHTLPALEMATYATNITFLDTCYPSTPHLFETFRQQRLLLIACGMGVIALVQAGLHCGIKQLGVIAAAEDLEQSTPAEGGADWLSPCDKEQIVHWISPPCWENEEEVRAVIQRYDAVVQIAGPSALPRARVLNRLCRNEGKVLIQAVVQDDQAWIGPLVSVETGNCWECAWWCWQAARRAVSRKPLGDWPLARAQGTLIAQQLLFALFQSAARAGADQLAGRVSVLDLSTWLSESHRFLPHPQCAACQQPAFPSATQFLAQIQQVQQRAPLQKEDFLRALLECIDEQCGLFTALDSLPFMQVPLAVSAVTLASPLSAKGPVSLEVIATGIDAQEARERALCKACERYAAYNLAPGSLCSAEVAQRFCSAVIAPDQLLGADPAVLQSPGWSWAQDLQTEQAALVPLHCLPPERGVASGQSWEEAVCQALLDWCTFLTLAHLQDVQRPYARVDLARVSLTPAGAYLLRQLQTVDARVAIYDVTGSLGVPTFAICLGERVVAYTTHYEAGQALDMGLTLALQQYQCEHFQQAAYALAPVQDCPLNQRSEQYCLPAYTLPDTWPARRGWLLARLQRSGWRSFALPLMNADPALAKVLPFLVRVFVCRSQEQKREVQ
jgi:bacteriocin biosynthesis cyclodehydratase domain-containing protein